MTTHTVSDSDSLSELQAPAWRVLDAIRARGTASRSQIVTDTGLSWGSVANALKVLEPVVIEKIEKEEGKAQRTGRTGPDSALLRVRGDVGVLLGLAIGVRKITAIALDFTFNPLPDVALPDPVDTGRSLSEFLASVRDHVSDCIRAVEKTGLPLLGVGFAWPGAVDHDRGVLRNAPNLGFIVDELTLADMLPREMFSELGDRAVVLDHDTECLAIAEMTVRSADGSTRQEREVFVAFLDEGVGAGLVLRGEVYRGAGNSAGEFGHFVVDTSPDATPCACGRSGCLEQFVSVPAVLRRAGVRDTGDLDAALASVDDETFAEVGKSLAHGLSYVVNLLNPELIILAGSLVTAYDRFYPTLRQRLGELAWRYGTENLRIEPSVLDQNGIASGAAISAYQALPMVKAPRA